MPTRSGATNIIIVYVDTRGHAISMFSYTIYIIIIVIQSQLAAGPLKNYNKNVNKL